MSAFKTSLPVDLEAVKRLLPKDHHIEKIVLDPANSRIDVIWHTSAIETPYTFPVEFPVADLEAKKLPAQAKLAAPRVKPERPSAPATVGKIPGAVIPPQPVKPGKIRKAKNAVSVEV